MPDTPVVVWFRRDLRLHDHPALSAAAQGGRPVVAVFVAGDDLPPPGSAARRWLGHSLAALDGSLRARGNRVVLRRGEPGEVLGTLAGETGADTVHVTRLYEPEEAAREASVATSLRAAGVRVRQFGGECLVAPDALRTGSGVPYRVFTPFHRAWSTVAGDPPTVPAPELTPLADPPESLSLADLDLGETKLVGDWEPGEAGAKARLADFVARAVAAYNGDRDRPDLAGTSRLSPHLHWGEISPRACFHAASVTALTDPSAGPGVTAFQRQLAWRDFARHLLARCPDMAERPMRPEFEPFPWRDNEADFEAWRSGMTGYPIVDAAMRELAATGWMHNRTRMIVASFLVKHLLLPWQMGAAWFMDRLVDADVANNSAGWQWVTGSGVDAAPYFRVFNPMLQGRKFDPDGGYVRAFVPELASLPPTDLHAPFEAPAGVLADAGIRLGETYPRPIVDHRAARERALAAMAEAREVASSRQG